MKTLIALVIGLALLGGGYYWFMSQEAPVAEVVPAPIIQEQLPPAQLPVETSSSTATTTPAAAVQGAVKEFNVTNTGMVFSEKAMTVNKGDRVKITYKNGGGTHDFRIDGYKVGTKVIAAGASETFEFVADKAGTFEFYCSVGSHRAMGMKGSFTVK